MSENRDGSILAAFLVGGIVGAAIGILFAPKSGKETREDIGEWVEDTMEKSKKQLAAAGEKLKEGAEKLGHTLQHKA